MRTLCKALAVLAAGAALALAPMAPSSAATSSPALVTGCNFRMTEIQAVDLRHDGRRDFVFLRIGATWYPPGGDGVMFVQGQKHGPDDFLMPVAGTNFGTAGLPVRHATDDFPVNHHIDRLVQCVPDPDGQLSFDDGAGVRYDMSYVVTTTS